MRTMKYVLNPDAIRDPNSIIDRCEKTILFEKRVGGQRVIELAKKRILTSLIVETILDIGLDNVSTLNGYGLEIYSKTGTYLEIRKYTTKTQQKPDNSEDIVMFMNKPKSKKILKTLKQNLSVRQTAKVCSCSINLVRKVKQYQT